MVSAAELSGTGAIGVTGRRHMLPAERDEAVRLYLADYTVDSIAEKFERDRRTICRLIGRRTVRRGRPRHSKSVKTIVDRQHQ